MLSSDKLCHTLPIVIQNVESSNRKPCGGQRFRVCCKYNIIPFSTERERERESGKGLKGGRAGRGGERSFSNIHICIFG